MIRRRGFTLVEMMVTLAVIGLAAALGMFAMSQALQTAQERDAAFRFSEDARHIRADMIRQGLYTIITSSKQSNGTTVTFGGQRYGSQAQTPCETFLSKSMAPDVVITRFYHELDVTLSDAAPAGGQLSNICFTPGGQPYSNDLSTLMSVKFDINDGMGKTPPVPDHQVVVDANGGISSTFDQGVKDGVASNSLYPYNDLGQQTPIPYNPRVVPPIDQPAVGPTYEDPAGNTVNPNLGGCGGAAAGAAAGCGGAAAAGCGGAVAGCGGAAAGCGAGCGGAAAAGCGGAAAAGCGGAAAAGCGGAAAAGCGGAAAAGCGGAAAAGCGGAAAAGCGGAAAAGCGGAAAAGCGGAACGGAACGGASCGGAACGGSCGSCGGGCGCGCGCGGCFVRGTLVATAKGLEPIESVKVGDDVMAYDASAGERGVFPVAAVFTRTVDELVILTVDGEVIETTREHPFWVDGSGFVKAGDLAIGDLLVGLSGDRRAVEKVDRLAGTFVVHNFHVEGAHTYFVTDMNLLVHNMSMLPF